MLGSFGSVGFRSIAHRSAGPARVKRGLPVPPTPGGVPGSPRACTLPDGRRVRDRGGMKTITSRAARAERPLLLAGLALVTAHLLDLALSGPDTSALGVAVDRRRRRGVGARPAARHPPDAARAGRRGRAGRRRLRRRLPRLACRQLGPRLARCHRHRLHRSAGCCSSPPASPPPRRRAARPAQRARLARRPRGRMGRRRRSRRRGRRAALRVRQHGRARSALGDRRVRRRDPARGDPHRDARRAQALGLVRPVAQRRGGPAQPWLGWQPRARPRPRADARAPRLRRAGARQPGQRRERRALQRPRRQRPAGHRRGPRLPRSIGPT